MKRILITTIVLLFAASTASAEELQFGWRSLVEYDSDISSNSEDSREELIFTNGPITELKGKHRRFEYSIEHYSAFEKYIEKDQLDDWRHSLRGSLSYDISPRVRFRISNSFRSQPILRNSTTEDGSEANSDAGFVSDVLSATLTLFPIPRMVATSQYSFQYRKFDNPSLSSQNTTSSTVQNQFNYRLTENHTFGGGFRYSTTTFESAFLETTTQTWEGFAQWSWILDSRSTLSARAGPAWSFDDADDPEFPETFVYPFFLLNFPVDIFDPSSPLVPTAFMRDPTTCPAENARPALGGTLLTAECFPALFQGEHVEINFFRDEPLAILQSLTDPSIDLAELSERDDVNTNVFFSFTLNRRWDRLNLALSWTRTDSQTQSLGAATVVDSVALNGRYNITSRLRLTVNFNFSRRFSDTDFEVLGFVVGDLEVIDEIPAPFPGVRGAPVVNTAAIDRSFKQKRDSYNFRIRLIRAFGRHSSSFIGLNLRRQDNEFDSADDFLDFEQDSQSFQILMGFTYRFEPIRF